MIELWLGGNLVECIRYEKVLFIKIINFSIYFDELSLFQFVGDISRYCFNLDYVFLGFIYYFLQIKELLKGKCVFFIY